MDSNSASNFAFFRTHTEFIYQNPSVRLKERRVEVGREAGRYLCSCWLPGMPDPVTFEERENMRYEIERKLSNSQLFRHNYPHHGKDGGGGGLRLWFSI
jgi:hypothetical protein